MRSTLDRKLSVIPSKQPLKRQQTESIKPQAAPVRELKASSSLRVEKDIDEIIAMEMQREEMMLNEELFMIEMMEERERNLQALNQELNGDHVDPDAMTYEVGGGLFKEMIELGEQIGTVKVGVSQEVLDRLPREPYDSKRHEDTQCVMCLTDFEPGQPVVVLKCCHIFDESCLLKWAEEHKECPVCKAEIK